MNLIPFDSAANLPSFVKKGIRKALDLTHGVGGGFPVLSIKGKTWSIVRSKDDRKMLMNPKDPDAAASSVSLVILAANKNLSRVFYEGGFEEGKTEKPTCFSNDGVTPDAGVEQPQAKTCGACKQAVFGPKGPPCATNRRLAVASPTALEDPMLLRVPGASLKNLAGYAAMLDGRGVPYDGVVTKIRFDAAEATPKLIFEPQAFVSDETYEQIQQAAQSEVVKQILGLTPVEVTETPAPKVTITADEVQEAVAAPAAKPKVEVTADEVQEAVAAPKKESKKVADLAEEREKKTPKKSGDDGMLDALDSFLGAYED